MAKKKSSSKKTRLKRLPAHNPNSCLCIPCVEGRRKEWAKRVRFATADETSPFGATVTTIVVASLLLWVGMRGFAIMVDTRTKIYEDNAASLRHWVGDLRHPSLLNP